MGKPFFKIREKFYLNNATLTHENPTYQVKGEEPVWKISK